MNRVSVPQDVFEKGILEQPKQAGDYVASWSYDQETGVVVVSSEKLKSETYKFVGNTKIGTKEDNYRVTVPQPLLGGGDNIYSAVQSVPEFAQLPDEEDLHFASHKQMISSVPRTTFVLSTSELTKLMGNHESVSSLQNKTPK
jgi:hypothetical protein